MAQVIELERARRERVARTLRSARDVHAEAEALCGKLEDAVARLREARTMVEKARGRIERSREELIGARRRLMRPIG